MGGRHRFGRMRLVHQLSNEESWRFGSGSRKSGNVCSGSRLGNEASRAFAVLQSNEGREQGGNRSRCAESFGPGWIRRRWSAGSDASAAGPAAAAICAGLAGGRAARTKRTIPKLRALVANRGATAETAMLIPRQTAI